MLLHFFKLGIHDLYNGLCFVFYFLVLNFMKTALPKEMRKFINLKMSFNLYLVVSLQTVKHFSSFHLFFFF